MRLLILKVAKLDTSYRFGLDHKDILRPCYFDIARLKADTNRVWIYQPLA
jgi:hypothetical protein